VSGCHAHIRARLLASIPAFTAGRMPPATA
jgi:hypothetical protein